MPTVSGLSLITNIYLLHWEFDLIEKWTKRRTYIIYPREFTKYILSSIVGYKVRLPRYKISSKATRWQVVFIERLQLSNVVIISAKDYTSKILHHVYKLN